MLKLGKQSGDSETQSGAAQLSAARLVDPEESVEDQVEMFRCDPGSGVLNGHADHAAVIPETDTNAAGVRVAHRVAGKIQQDVPGAVGVTVPGAEVRIVNPTTAEPGQDRSARRRSSSAALTL